MKLFWKRKLWWVNNYYESLSIKIVTLNCEILHLVVLFCVHCLYGILMESVWKFHTINQVDEIYFFYVLRLLSIFNYRPQKSKIYFVGIMCWRLTTRKINVFFLKWPVVLKVARVLRKLSFLLVCLLKKTLVEKNNINTILQNDCIIMQQTALLHKPITD